MEKKPCLIAALFVVMLPGVATGQRLIEYGLKGGVNLASSVHGDRETTSPRVGYHAGLYHRRGIWKVLTFRSEIFYSVEGEFYTSTSTPFPNSTMTIHKLSTPLLLEVGGKVTMDLGAQVGWLLAADNTLTNPPPGFAARRDLSDKLEWADFSLVGGIGFHPANHFEASIRYDRGMTRVFETNPAVPHRQQFSSKVLQFTIGYSF